MCLLASPIHSPLHPHSHTCADEPVAAWACPCCRTVLDLQRVAAVSELPLERQFYKAAAAGGDGELATRCGPLSAVIQFGQVASKAVREDAGSTAASADALPPGVLRTAERLLPQAVSQLAATALAALLLRRLLHPTQTMCLTAAAALWLFSAAALAGAWLLGVPLLGLFLRFVVPGAASPVESSCWFLLFLPPSQSGAAVCRYGMAASCYVVLLLAALLGCQGDCYSQQGGLPLPVTAVIHLCGKLLAVEAAKHQRRLWSCIACLDRQGLHILLAIYFFSALVAVAVLAVPLLLNIGMVLGCWIWGEPHAGSSLWEQYTYAADAF